MVLRQRIVTCQQMKSDHTSPHIKINSECIKDPNVITWIIEFLQGNIEVDYFDLSKEVILTYTERKKKSVSLKQL